MLHFLRRILEEVIFCHCKGNVLTYFIFHYCEIWLHPIWCRRRALLLVFLALIILVAWKSSSCFGFKNIRYNRFSEASWSYWEVNDDKYDWFEPLLTPSLPSDTTLSCFLRQKKQLLPPDVSVADDPYIYIIWYISLADAINYPPHLLVIALTHVFQPPK